VLNRVATANLSVPTDKIVYTQFLNERGGIEADLTVTRLADDGYLVVTAAFTHTHVEALIRARIPNDAHCVVTDVSGAYSMLNLQGPSSRALLRRLTGRALSNEEFPFGTSQQLQIGYQTVLALRITYAGELGWELYVPTAFTLPVYDALIEAGRDFGLRHCGYHTLNSLRIEKAYREWGHDIGPLDTPLEAGLAFTCAWQKPEGFIGREALLRQREAGPLKRRLVQFVLEDPEPLLYHNEPIYRDGVLNSYTTSAMYGHSLGAAVAMGYLVDERGVSDDFILGGRYEIEIGNTRHPARASLAPLYDPKSTRVRV